MLQGFFPSSAVSVLCQFTWYYVQVGAVVATSLGCQSQRLCSFNQLCWVLLGKVVVMQPPLAGGAVVNKPSGCLAPPLFL